MKVQIIPITEMQESVLCAYGAGFARICGLDDQNLIFHDTFGATSIFDVDGAFAEEASEAIDRHIRRLTRLPERRRLGKEVSHHDRNDRLYELGNLTKGPGCVAGPQEGGLRGTVTIRGATLESSGGIRLADVTADVGLVRLNPMVHGASAGKNPGIELNAVFAAEATNADRLLASDAMILHLGVDRPAHGDHAAAMCELLLRMARLAAAGTAEFSDAVETPDHAVKLRTIVIAVGSTGMPICTGGRYDCLADLEPNILFEEGMLPLLTSHADLLQAAALLSENLRLLHGRDSTPPLLFVPLDFHGDLADGSGLNRDPIAPARSLLRSRDFAPLSGDHPSDLWIAMMDVLRASWRPFNLLTPLVAAMFEAPSKRVFTLDTTDWSRIGA